MMWKAVVAFVDGSRDVWEYLTQEQANAVVASYKNRPGAVMGVTVPMEAAYAA